MAQHDFEIDNQTAPPFRADLNDALQALATLSSGATAPATTYPNMLWYDSGNNLLKMRSEADDAWIDIGTLNQSTNTFEVANLTELTKTQAEDDTDTTYGLVNGERLGQAVESNLNVTGSAPMYACRAWVNFDGTGTVAIRASGNVSSITDNGTGDYTVNFAAAIEDANYSVVATAQREGGAPDIVAFISKGASSNLTTSAVPISTESTSGNSRDCVVGCVSIFR